MIRASQQINTTVTLRVQILKNKFNQSLGLPFKELLPSSAIEQALEELKIKYKKRLFDPFVTLWAFLSGKAEVRRQKAEGLCRRASGDRREQGFKTPTKFILVACNW
ncbi:hypothetical protein [Mastigocoleus testarum]|uniref:hypothetical protein n=1 Tax=Mastigocoleus testarum TaxID=996925 RepID=UPI001910317C|nr:hypothetical protein [Mastigocoleus testarum]